MRNFHPLPPWYVTPRDFTIYVIDIQCIYRQERTCGTHALAGFFIDATPSGVDCIAWTFVL
ncbi:MAG: hypothetical protein JJU28_05980 [Cyclobacteriaceae bacterium]|nr:hypothetical protein [Cyclobacteriaceae bacterium]